jgi:RimJ/RimL family protein N-acetyltransferase
MSAMRAVPREADPHTRIHITLLDGTRVVLRPVVPSDADGIAHGFDHLSEESRYRRFMGGLKRLTPAVLTRLTVLDYHDRFAWLAIAIDEPGQPGIAVARYVRLLGDPTTAEPAVTVIDEFQGRGLGTTMLDVLARSARANGIERFVAYALVDNRPVLAILKRNGARLRVSEPGVYEAIIDLPAA